MTVSMVIVLLLVYILFILICIAFGIIYLIRKACQNRDAISQIPFNLYQKFISPTNILVMALSFAIAVVAVHIFLKLPREYVANHIQFVLSPQGHGVLTFIFVLFPAMCRVISNKILIPRNMRIKLIEQIAVLWWPSFLFISYFYNLCMFYSVRPSLINTNNESIIVVLTFIIFWIASTSTIRSLRKAELSFD